MWSMGHLVRIYVCGCGCDCGYSTDHSGRGLRYPSLCEHALNSAACIDICSVHHVHFLGDPASQGRTADDCCAACAGIPACKAFVFVRSRRYLTASMLLVCISIHCFIDSCLVYTFVRSPQSAFISPCVAQLVEMNATFRYYFLSCAIVCHSLCCGCLLVAITWH